MSSLHDIVQILVTTGNSRSRQQQFTTGGAKVSSEDSREFKLVSGIIINREGDGHLIVNVNGLSVICGQTTDEPFEIGQKVWVSQTDRQGSYVVIGSLR